MRTQRVSASEDGEILQDDSVEERGHKLIGRNALLLQSVNVSFREDTAFAGDRMQLEARVSLIAKLLGGDLQLGIDLVDNCTSAAGAFVIHGGNLLLATGVFVFFEDNNLGVLTTELDH